MKSTELYQIYQSALDSCIANISEIPGPGDGGPAFPLTIQPPVGYEEAKLKVMYFGQETNGWKDNSSDHFNVNLNLEQLLIIYNAFANTHKCFGYGGQFWNAVRRFQRDFSSVEPNCHFIYNNIIKIGKAHSKGRPPTAVLEWQKDWFNLIREEIRILNPDVVIFFSGPNYDHLISRIFDDVNFDKVGEYKTRKLARISSSFLPRHTFRTYHPNYLWRVGLQGVLDTIKMEVCEKSAT
ncbi:MAG: hypothetical protein RLZZ505_3335 [Verrucomicrobiota bacterium]|jgi:hypothetical protein